MADVNAPAEADQKGKAQKRGIVTRTTFGTVAGDRAILTATATCPKRTRAVGGGFAVPRPESGYSALVFESQKVGQRQWRASAQMSQASPFTPKTITVDAYCRRGAPATTTVASTVPTPDGSPLHLNGPATSAPCPSNRRLTAGGFSTPPPLGDFGAANAVRRSEPTGNSWTTEVESDNHESGVSSYAYCAKLKRSQPHRAVAATATGANPAPSSSTTVTATCAGKRTMVDGGFAQTYLLQIGGGTFQVLESRRVGKSWVAVADQGGDSTATSFSSVGLCAPKSAKRLKKRR
jgi:hypothetical protein